MRMLLTYAALLLVPAAATAQTFPTLLANGPAPEHRDALMLFGQFVGDWVFDGVEYNTDGSRQTDRGEIHFAWILQGRAVQDVFIENERSDTMPKLYGTTVRLYDPVTDRWLVTFTDPPHRTMRMLVGGKVGDEIVLEGTTTTGTPVRWIFSEITNDRFHWHGERSTGSGWRTYEEFTAHRQR
jgi:hypothetical protein